MAFYNVGLPQRQADLECIVSSKVTSTTYFLNEQVLLYICYSGWGWRKPGDAKVSKSMLNTYFMAFNLLSRYLIWFFISFLVASSFSCSSSKAAKAAIRAMISAITIKIAAIIAI